MSWDARGYGGHGGSAATPNTRWLFAEGSQGYFHTYVLLANNDNVAANVTVTILLEGGETVVQPVTVDAHARLTVDAAAIPELANRSFGIEVVSDRDIMVERSRYLPGARLFEGGHESAGVNSPSTQWFLAEGATGSFFECFILMSNPGAAPANVTLTYLLDTGATVMQQVSIPVPAEVAVRFLRIGAAPIVKSYTVAPTSRMNVWVNNDVPELGAGTFSAEVRVLNYQPIAVEKALYWDSEGAIWAAGTNVTATLLPPDAPPPDIP